VPTSLAVIVVFFTYLPLAALAFALIGSVVGGMVAGGVDVILGFAIGFAFRLGEAPITSRRRQA
jgi:hypothetical protein